MADLTLATAAEVHAVEIIEKTTLPAAEVIAAGYVIGIDTNGNVVAADADTGPIVARGVAINGASAAGLPVTFIRKGLVDLGDILGDLAFEAAVYPSGTAGYMSDSQVNSQPALGQVVPAWGYTTVDKLLRVNL